MTKIAIMVIAAIFCTIQPALAHPKLLMTAPESGTLTQTPHEIRLSFSETLVPKFSGLDLKDQEGKLVETGPASSDPKDRKQLVVPVKAVLPPGRYTVEWHVVSEDTHRVKGSYTFEIKP